MIDRARFTCFLFAGCLLFFFCGSSCFAQYDHCPVIPRPVRFREYSGNFMINKTTRILIPSGSGDDLSRGISGSISGAIAEPLRELTGFSFEVTTKAKANFLQFRMDTIGLRPEGYRLVVDAGHIEVVGFDEAGLFYAIQTLTQLMKTPGPTGYPVAACSVEDYPRFHYRGMHLDVSRHFFTVPVIEKWINALALFKINTFQWHLTDDQGWRIEIKKYPRLQSISAWRDETLIGHKKELPHRFDGKKYGGFYTQDEIREVVRYASARHITVIPEIEMPGHAQAVLAAYPNLGCTGGPYKTAPFWGIFEDVYCAGNDSVFTFLQDVLDEVTDLFPSKYIHIGGDECLKTRWQVCPKCQRRIREQGLTDEHALQSYFIHRISNYLNAKGRSIIGWNEILEGGLTPGATVMSWQGEEAAMTAAIQKHNVILSTESSLYFDYYQSLYPEEPLAAGGFTSLQKVFSYVPLAQTNDPEILQYVSGVQGQLWSEYLPTPEQAEYMLFPRAVALAEVAWRQDGMREQPWFYGNPISYRDFLRRLRSQETLLKKMNIHFADNFDEIGFTSKTAEGGKIEVVLNSTLPGASIRYTLDGKEPGTGSKLYASPLVLEKSTVVHARLYEKEKPFGRVFRKQFYLHKAVGASVTLAHPAMSRFDPGPPALVNGLTGSDRYNDGQWLGFSGTDLEATIDLGRIVSIGTIRTAVLNYHWQRMWAPLSLQFSVSTDGREYKEVYRQTDFPVNGINHVEGRFPLTEARYLKVTGINKGIIPAGEYGAGAKASLLIDEISVE